MEKGLFHALSGFQGQWRRRQQVMRHLGQWETQTTSFRLRTSCRVRASFRYFSSCLRGYTILSKEDCKVSNWPSGSSQTGQTSRAYVDATRGPLSLSHVFLFVIQEQLSLIPTSSSHFQRLADLCRGLLFWILGTNPAYFHFRGSTDQF